MTLRAASLVELARASVSRFGDRPLFGELSGGSWQWMTYAEWQVHVNDLRAGLASLGVGRGDCVAIISRNSAAWAAAAYASYGLGATFVAMYEAQRPADWEFVLRDCQAKLVFGRTPLLAATLAAMQPRLPALRHIVTIEGTAADPHTFAALEQRGRAAPVGPSPVEPDDLAALIYTSGTTGLPKGVMLTHRNLTSNVAATLSALPLRETDRTLSVLPWAHALGQVCELHMLIGAGASTAFNVTFRHFGADLRVVKPTVLVAVPRILDRMRDDVRAHVATWPRAIRHVFEQGLAASIRRRRGERLGFVDRLRLQLARIPFAAIRRELGGRLEYALCGSAPLLRDVAELIDGVGIEVLEGYGLTETSPIVTVNRPGQRKLGSVGLPIEDVRVELDESRGLEPGEGEIVVHGPNVMKGYHARPDDNASVFTPDGGLRTGDLGRIDADGYLSITGRIKEEYKLENGKYVVPGPLEEQLARSPYIRNVMLYGSGRDYNVALVVINSDHVRSWAADQHIDLAADITRDPRVRTLIQDQLDRNASELRGYERPRACTLTEQPFTLANGLLTPTLKIKRQKVTGLYRAALEALYAEPRPPQPPVGRPSTSELATTH